MSTQFTIIYELLQKMQKYDFSKENVKLVSATFFRCFFTKMSIKSDFVSN